MPVYEHFVKDFANMKVTSPETPMNHLVEKFFKPIVEKPVVEFLKMNRTNPITLEPCHRNNAPKSELIRPIPVKAGQNLSRRELAKPYTWMDLAKQRREGRLWEPSRQQELRFRLTTRNDQGPWGFNF